MRTRHLVKQLLMRVDFNRIIEMMKKTNEHKLAKKYLNGIIEQSHYFKWGWIVDADQTA